MPGQDQHMGCSNMDSDEQTSGDSKKKMVGNKRSWKKCLEEVKKVNKMPQKEKQDKDDNTDTLT